jgi:hypothetical protein
VEKEIKENIERIKNGNISFYKTYNIELNKKEYALIIFLQNPNISLQNVIDTIEEVEGKGTFNKLITSISDKTIKRIEEL